MNLSNPNRLEMSGAQSVTNLAELVNDTLDHFAARISAAWQIEHAAQGAHADVTLALGSATAFDVGIGIWMSPSLVTGLYQFRVGDPDGGYLEWDGSSLNISGSVTITGYAKADLTNVTGNYAGSSSVGGSANDTALVNGVAAATVEDGAGRAITGLSSLGVPTLPSTATPSGSGLFLGSDKLGYYAAGAWKTYMDNSGNFYLGGTSGNLQWNGTTLTISGSITVTGGNAAKTDFSNVTANYAGSASVGGSATDTALVNGVAAATVSGGAARANSGLDSSGYLVTKVTPATAVGTPGASGLYLGSDKMGYYNGSSWLTYMDNSGQMFFGSSSTANSLSWNGTTLAVNSATVYIGKNGTAHGSLGLWSATETVLGGTPTPSAGMYMSGTTQLHIFNNYTGSTIYLDVAARCSSTLNVVGATDLDSTLNVDGAVTLQSTLHGIGAVDFDSTLNVDGVATLASASITGVISVVAGAQQVDTNGDWRPDADNSRRVGLGTHRYTLIRGVTVTAGDFGFENGFAFTESYKVGIAEPGIALVNPEGEVVAFFGASSMRGKGLSGNADVDHLPHVVTTAEDRAQMDAHPEQRVKGYANDGAPVYKTASDVAPFPDYRTARTTMQRKTEG